VRNSAANPYGSDLLGCGRGDVGEGVMQKPRKYDEGDVTVDRQAQKLFNALII